MGAEPIPVTPTPELLKNWALEAGFDRAGIARHEPSEPGDHLRRWLARGDHASMEWIARRVELREEPSKLFPGARSTLCVALQYHPLEGEPEAAGDLWPRVARYARGRDYHDVMKKRLKALGRRIVDAFPEADARCYVDTAPVLERELAARSGLGVQGKNTNLLHRRWGSYFLLGELFLTLDLEPSPASPELAGVTDVCGHCTRCLDACPTGALPEPFRLDSRRCISYWTIEHRGDLPEAAREMVGDWVFGCDVCQEVCPWNAKAGEGTEDTLRLPPERAELDLAGLLRLDREGYLERFTKSPMKRAKLEGLKRNAAVAMGNRRDRAYVPALEAALSESAPIVRRHAAWSLGKVGGAAARQALELARDVEEDVATRQEIGAALDRLRSEPLTSS